MTRKDYQLFAEYIRDIRDIELRNQIATICAIVFYRDNPRFKPDLFYRACNVDDG